MADFLSTAPVCEEANQRGLLETNCHNGRQLVRFSQDGLAFLGKRRPY